MNEYTKALVCVGLAAVVYLCVQQIAYKDGYDRCMSDTQPATDAQVQALIDQLGQV